MKNYFLGAYLVNGGESEDVCLAAFAAQFTKEIKIKETDGKLNCTARLDLISGLLNSKKILVFDHAAKNAYYVSLMSDSKQEECTCLDLTLTRNSISLDMQPAVKLESKKFDELYAMALILYSSELSGIAAKAVGLTVNYVKERKQFNLPVGGFQAVQQKLADASAGCQSH